MFAAPGKLTEVGVNQSVPLREKFPEMVAADATPQRLREIAVANAIRKFFFIFEILGRGFSKHVTFGWTYSNSHFLDNQFIINPESKRN
jgi:hypothetical protein